MADTDNTIEALRAFRATVMALVKNDAPNMSQTELHKASGLWPDWEVGGFYVARQLVRFEGRMYFVLADVNAAGSDEDSRPDKDTEHYKLMSDPDENGVFPFSMPLGDSDAYGRGDKVTLQGVTYVSLTDGNKSIPGVNEGAKYWAKA